MGEWGAMGMGTGESKCSSVVEGIVFSNLSDKSLKFGPSCAIFCYFFLPLLFTLHNQCNYKPTYNGTR